jgi:glycosyltransferase involved in cell wall biosynthesis
MSQRSNGDVGVSLVVATLGRTRELECLLKSIAGQTLKNLELVIVDQNEDDRVERVIQGLSLPYIHIRSPRGLSRARNAGIQASSGEIVGFPDDDCWYPDNFLLQVKQRFDRDPACDFLCCTAQDERGRAVAARWARDSHAIDRSSVLRACASASLFMRKTSLDQIGGFDERLGLGAATPFQSAEDSDLALRCLNSGAKGWFDKQLFVYHPHKEAGREACLRALDYGLGFGCFLRMHGYSASTWLYHVVRALGGASTSLLLAKPGKALFYWNSARGRVRGYLLPKMVLHSGK